MTQQAASTPSVVEHRIGEGNSLHGLVMRAAQSGFTYNDDLMVVAREPGVWEATLTGPDISANYGHVPDPLLMIAELITDPDEAFLFGLRSEGTYTAALVEEFGGTDYRWELHYEHSAQHGPLRIRIPVNW
jgi:hypothetical protein